MTRGSRALVLVAASLCCVSWVQDRGGRDPDGTGAKANPPRPSFKRIDYSSPESYLRIDPTLGNEKAVEKIAADLKGTDEEKLLAIYNWVTLNVPYDENAPYGWRTFDDLLAQGKYGGCANHSVLFGSLTRACGIPTVWVKTMDIDWIREFQANDGKCSTWRGHVFLEVHIDGRWRLLDATQGVLYKDYDPSERILPGDRYAYDKGGDPYALILSMRWELWKRQTREYFMDFDQSQIPFRYRTGHSLLDKNGVFVAGNDPIYVWVAVRCKALGYRVPMTFNCRFAEILPRSRGNHLIVTCVGDDLVLPEKYRESLLPTSKAELDTIMEKTSHGVLRRVLKDGTQVHLVFGTDENEIKKAIETLTLGNGKPSGSE